MTTKDAGLVAALYSLNFHEEKVDSTNPKECYFHFSDSAEIHKIADEYYSGELKISAFSYNQAMKAVKARIYHIKDKVYENQSYLYR